MMRLIVKSPVWDDLREIGQQIAKDSLVAVDHFYTAAQGAFDLLARHPGIGRLRSFSLPGVRSWVIPEFKKYVIFYLPAKTEVQVLAVLHGARDLANVLEERLE